MENGTTVEVVEVPSLFEMKHDLPFFVFIPQDLLPEIAQVRLSSIQETT